MALGAPVRASFPGRVRREWVVLLLFAIGVAIRVAVNNVTSFSAADETTYVNYSRAIVAEPSGYRGVVQYFLNTPGAWIYPNPSRWISFLVDSLSCRIAPCDYRTLTWVSTLSGIAVLPVVYAVGRRLLSPSAALLGTAFAVTSPLLLGLGRRALQDEFFVLVIWLALLAVVRLLDGNPRRIDYGLAVVALGLAFSAKDSFGVFYVAFAVMFLTQRSRTLRWADVSLLVGPPLVFFGGFALFAGSPGDLIALERIVLGLRTNADSYELVTGSGPFYQPILDFIILAPLVTLVAIAGCGAAIIASPGKERRLVAVTLACFVLFGILLKNVRYAAAVAPMLALIAGWTVSEKVLRPRGLLRVGGIAAAAVNATVEAWVFWTVFVVGGVYDPVIVNLLRAVHAIP